MSFLQLLGRSRAVLLIVLILFSSLSLKQNFASANNDECAQLQSSTLTEEAPITDEYGVWVLAKSATQDASAFLQVDDGSCHSLNLPQGDDWQWVSGKDRVITEIIQAGVHDFKVSMATGEVEVDKVLVTSELDCVPQGNGYNCVEVPLDFVVSGISVNETVGDERALSIELVNPESELASVDFNFDDSHQKVTVTSAPYCYIAGDAENCGKFAFSTLGNGAHNLSVTARTPAGQQKTLELPFTVTSMPVENAPATPNPSAELPQIEFSIDGLSDNQKVSGKVTVNVVPTNISKPITILYRLDDKQIATRSIAPFCMTDSKTPGQCGEWNTTRIANGEYKLSVLAVAEGYQDTQKVITLNVDNKVVSVSQPKKPKSIVVLGNGKQKTSGTTELKVPEQFIQRSGIITYKVNDETVAIKTNDEPFAILDTTEYINGNYVLSATTSSLDGSESTVSSEVEINNTWLKSSANWADEHRIASGFIILTLAGIAFLISFVVSRYLKHRKFHKSHNLKDYDAPTEEFLFKYFNRMKHVHLKHGITYGATASLVTVGVLTGLFVFASPTNQAKGLGFVVELQNGVTSNDSTFSLIKNMSENRISVLLKSTTAASTTPDNNEDTVSDGDHSGDGHEDTNHDDETDSGTGVGDGDSAPSIPANGSASGSTGGSGSGSGGTTTPPPSSTPTTPTAPTQCTPGIGVLTQHGPCIVNSLIPASVQGLSTVRIDNIAPITRNAGEAGAFRHRCDYSHMNYDDSVLYYNQPGAAHLHTYFGNTGTRASSTSNSLLSSGNSTCAGGTFNRSAYWVPSMIDTASGQPIRPSDPRTIYHSDLEIYYKLGYQGVGYQDVIPFPNGLQMIAGNPGNATAPTSNTHVNYWCENNSQMDRINRGASMPICNQGQILTMEINFPQCWNGVNLTTPNGRSHLAYGTWQPGNVQTSVGCPSSHPVGLPSIEMFVRYRVNSGNTANWRLSSDNYTNGPGGYSGHADYVFAWQAGAFQTVVDRCYRTLFDCYYQLGDGRDPRSFRY